MLCAERVASELAAISVPLDPARVVHPGDHLLGLRDARLVVGLALRARRARGLESNVRHPDLLVREHGVPAFDKILEFLVRPVVVYIYIWFRVSIIDSGVGAGGTRFEGESVGG